MGKTQFLIPRILGILFAVSFIITACPEIPEFEIKSVDLSGLQPEKGKTPQDLLDKIKKSSQYSIDVIWNASGTPIDNDEKFIKKEVYTADVTLTAQEGCFFNETAKVTLTESEHLDNNSIPVISKDKITVTLEFTALPDDLPIPSEALDLTKIIPQPTTGSYPPTIIGNSRSPYSGTIEWKPTVGSGGFEAGKKYTATVTITANADWVFPDPLPSDYFDYTFTDKEGETIDKGSLGDGVPSINTEEEDGNVIVTVVFPPTADAPSIGFIAYADGYSPSGTSTLITVIFDEPIEDTISNRTEVTISPTGRATIDTTKTFSYKNSADKTVWGLPINVTTTGIVKLTITHGRISKEGIDVMVFKDGDPLPTFNDYSVTANGGPATPSTELTFTFGADPDANFAERNIIIEDEYTTGKAKKGKLTGTGPTRTLAITGVIQGSTSVKVAHADFNPESKPLTLYDGGGVTAVIGVTLDENTLDLAPGGSGTLTATITPAGATNKTVTWISDNPNVTVSPAGPVLAGTVTVSVAAGAPAGTATITVTTADGSFTATCAVTITTSAVPVTLTKTDVAGTTTELIITLGGAVPGLLISDITFGGTAVITTGTLTTNDDTVYTLPVTAITTAGTVTVTISKTGIVGTVSNSVTVIKAAGGSDKPKVVVEFKAPEDEIINLPDISADKLPITVTVTGTYASYAWVLDGTVINGATENSLTITTAHFPASNPLFKWHTVTAIVEVVKDGKSYYYSKTLNFRIVP
jgi:uncharacterized protein YjdB